MTPEHFLHIEEYSTPELNITCVLRDEAGQPVPLAGCQYRNEYLNVTLQFNEGPASINYTHAYGWTHKYHGRGLEHGECGLTVQGYENYHTFFLGCRVRPLAGAWKTAAMLLHVKDDPSLQYHLEPPGATLALAGSEVTIDGKAEYKIGRCWFHVPPKRGADWFMLDSGPGEANHSRGLYHGAGLDHKECGITILNVQPNSSGFVQSQVFISINDSWTFDFIELIVATAPDDVGITNPTITKEDGILRATCWSKRSRPVANITWLLDDQVIRQDSTNEGVEAEWLWEHDPQSITQHLLYNVTQEDHGKQLVCRVGHMALPSGVVDIKITLNLNFKYLEYRSHYMIAVVICGLLVVALGFFVGLLWFYKQLCWSAYSRQFEQEMTSSRSFEHLQPS